MDIRSPLNQCIALALAGILFLNPIAVAAAELAVDQAGGNTSLGHAGNGVPIVNIATPNGSGLSHNQFREYNVGAQGLILNNATDRTQATQLGGLILGNPNLGGQAASTILNEVTGSNRSQLNGYTEVAGQSARVIVANPHGLTCNGCGFLNTPRATLATGKPIVEGGRLDRFQVDGGDIALEGAGLNAGNIDQFELITRSARLNADLHARQLTIVAGRNEVDADSLKATPRAPDGSAPPTLAIDSSALGGMYAGAIRLVGTEAGVGVRLAGHMAASAGDLQIDASGQLTLAQATASGDLRITAQGAELTGQTYAGGSASVTTVGDLVNRQSLAARDAVRLSSGGQLNNQGVIEAGVNPDNRRNGAGDLQVEARDLRNSGSLVASRNLAASARQTLDNQGGTLSSQGKAQVSASQLDNRQGRVLATGDLALVASELKNGQGGLVSCGGKLEATLGHLDNRGGELSSQTTVKLQVGSVDNQAGKVIAQQQLRLDAEGAVDNRGGLLSGWQGLALSGQTLDNSGKGTLSSRQGEVAVDLQADLLNQGEGAVVSQGRLTVRASRLDNQAGGLLSSGAGQVLDLTGALDNRDGGLIDSGAELALNARNIVNAGGRVSAAGDLSLAATDLDNRAGHIGSNGRSTLRLLGMLTNTQGTLASQGALLLQGARQVHNQGGQIASQGLLTLLIGELDNRLQGTLAASGALLLRASGAVLNDDGGLIYSRDGGLTLSAARLDNQGGTLQGQGDLRLESATVANRGGQILSRTGNVDLSGHALDNRGGTLASLQGWVRARLDGWLDNGVHAGQGGILQAQSVDLATARLDNQGGHVSALVGDARLVVGQLDNRNGGLFAKESLQFSGRDLTNGGQIAAGRVDVSLAGALDNQAGIIESDTTLALTAAALDNRHGQLRALGTGGHTQLQVQGLFDNQGGVLESPNTTFGLNVGSLQNAGGEVLHLGTGAFDLATAALTDAGGSLVTRGALTLKADHWRNSGVLQAASLTVNVGQFTQTASGQLLASQAFHGSGGDWSNDGLIASDGDFRLDLAGTYSGAGRLSSLGDFSLDVGQLTLAAAGRLSGGGSTRLLVGGVLSNQGRITAAGDLSVTAGSLHNFGTLGSAERLRLVTPTLHNERGLIFSGADMTLRVGAFTNRYADLYSLGALDLAADDAGARSTLLENISATLESAGDMRLAVAQLINRKDVFRADLARHAGRITITATDNCKGKHCWALYNVQESYQAEVIEDSASASLIAGGNLSFRGDTFSNQYSLVSAAGDLEIVAQRLSNIGAAGGYERTRHYEIYTRSDAEYWGFVQNQALYNRYNDPESVEYDPSRLDLDKILIGVQQSDNSLSTSGPVIAQAIIQAGGRISIQAEQDIINGSVRPGAPGAGGASRVQDTGTSSATLSTPAQLNAQLPPDLAQQQVNPLNLPGFSLPEGENGLFRLSGQGGSAPGPVGSAPADPASPAPAGPHRYLIETNPALTDLKQFMGSDYLLGRLGYDPDQAQKRLGDGLYEQRLIREAVAARTGQRFLAGLNSDEAMFRYLMDNALASQQALNLSVGVSLSAAQVAALTHDIVWLETQVVNGEPVLVPVLYLAQAKGRLAPNGALIQGQDVALIAGGELRNQGTLRASQNLKASARDLGNTGLVEAGQRLELLATDSIRNAQGGIFKGRDVSAIARTGDLVNERSVSTLEHGGASLRQTDSVLNAAARIEAADSLSLSAGRDLTNLGSHISAGGNANLSAGRDLAIAAATEVDSSEGRGKKSRWSETTVTQHGSEVQVGGDLKVEAGRDLAVVASRVSAERDIELTAGRDLDITSAANESHFESHTKGKGKKLDIERDSVRQQGSVIDAGGDFTAVARRDLTLTASRVQAGDEAYLYAGNDLSLLAAADSDHSLYDKQKKGRFGSKQARRDEVTDVRHVGSEIRTGGDLTLASEGDQRYQAPKLESGRDLTLDSGGAISFEAVKDLRQESHEKSKSNLAWVSMKGEGRTDETLRQSQLVAQGELAIKAVDGLKIDLKQIDQQTVSQTIDAMVQADPSLAWLKQMEQRGDVDWQRVKEVHDSFKYSQSGLGVGAQLAIAIVVTYLTWGAGASLSGAGAGTAQAGAANAVANAVAVNTAVSTVNNKGHLGSTLKDVTSSDSLKNYVAAGVGGGLALNNVGLQLAVNSAMKTLVNGGKFKDNLTQAAIDLAANALTAAIYAKVGDSLVLTGLPTKVAVHALVGGLIAEAAGGDFRTGALAAGANEALIDAFGKDLFPGEAHERVLAMTSQLIGITVAAAAGGDEKAQEKAGWVAQQATLYNHDLHRKNAESFAKGILDACRQAPTRCDVDSSAVTNDEIIRTLEVMAAHGEGIGELNPDAIKLVNQFYLSEQLRSTLEKDLFYPTDSEGSRLEIERKAELAIAALTLGHAALEGGPVLLSKLKDLAAARGAGNKFINGRWVDAEGLPLPVSPSVGSSGRVPNVLQSGGHVLNKKTANALNEYFDKGMTSREWGRALESLKRQNGLRNDFHGRILDDGSYVDRAGNIIGNIADYLP